MGVKKAKKVMCKVKNAMIRCCCDAWR